MIEFIIDIWDNIVDLYQQFFGVPEGVTYALFGSKKKKKAKRQIANATKQIGELDNLKISTSNPEVEGIPSFNEEIATDENKFEKQPSNYKPEFPYRGNQIIIDSDRVLINSKNDSTFIIGKKAVGISSGGTFNIDSTDKTIINSPEIDLGLQASHPIIYGDEFFSALNNFLKVIDTVVCENNLNIATDSNNTDIATVQRAGKALQEATRNLSKKLPSVLSEKVKTI